MRSLALIGLIGAEFLSQLGNQIATIAIPILVLQFTHSPIATGIAGAGARVSKEMMAGSLTQQEFKSLQP